MIDRKYNNHGGGSYNQRRPYDRSSNSEPKEDEQEDIEVRLKGLIIKIGDKVMTCVIYIYIYYIKKKHEPNILF